MAITSSLLIIALLSFYQQFSSNQTVCCHATSDRLYSSLNGINLSSNNHRHKRNLERDFAPKFIHQPHSERVQALKPHTVECPVESQPESEIKWFKDGRQLQSEPTHLEQTGNELMFFQINDDDSGDYYCEASNYLGTITSDQFKLHVQSTQRDSRIQLEPKRVQVAPSQSVEFTCRLPSLSTTAADVAAVPAISWRKNGKRLVQVVWLSSADNQAGSGGKFWSTEAQQAKYLAKQVQRNEFSLLVRRVSLNQDNNTTFSCVYEGAASDLDGQTPSESPDSSSSVLARESDDSLLLVNQSDERVKIDVNMGPPPPMDQFGQINATSSGEQQTGPTSTTRLSDNNGRQLGSLGETLLDLYAVAKPSLIAFALMCLLSLIVLLLLVTLRRRARSTHRYMKHHQFFGHPQHAGPSSCSSAIASSVSSSSASSSSSSASNGAATRASLIGDPMLGSLLSRTLSAPTAASFVAGRKYKQYRDQMRKVAQARTTTTPATNNDFTPTGADFLDAANFLNALASDNNNYYTQQQPQMPNLYDQSLAAREQARSLLQTSEHMRSLSNLAQVNGHLDQQLAKRRQQQQQLNHGSHLNLPLNFSLADRTPQQLDANQLISSANNFLPLQQQQHHLIAARQQPNESHPLVNCSSVSPSSSSATTATGGSDRATTTAPDQTKTNNHYSTIETDDCADYEPAGELRYEQLGSQRNRPQRASASSVSSISSQNKLHKQTGSRSSGRISTFMNSDTNGLEQEKIQTQFKRSQKLFASARNNKDEITKMQHNQYRDQLSPYAVSSIYTNQHQPPPVTSEAMRALNEQFDIDQLMMVDEAQSTDNQDQRHGLLFHAPPPPPSPPPQNNDWDAPQQRKIGWKKDKS